MPGSSSRIDRSIFVYRQLLFSRIGRIAGRHVRRIGFRVILILNTDWNLDRIPMGSVCAVLQRDRNALWAFLVEVAKIIPRLLQRQIKYGDVMLIGDCCCISFFSRCNSVCLKLYRCRRFCRL